MLALHGPRALSLLVTFLLGACSESPRQRADAGPLRDGARDAVVDRQSFERLPDVLPSDARPGAVDRCGGGGFLVPQGSTLTVQGSTTGLGNQYGGAIRCGGAAAFQGPQRYYSIDLDETKTYRFSLSPKFDAAFYLFGACGESIINADCSSGGATGAQLSVAAGASGSLVFRPRATGSYELAIDSEDAATRGDFALTVEVFASPPEASCATAATLSFSAGVAQVQGTTLGALNEFDAEVGCGLGLDFDGPQVYYAIDLAADQTYELSLTPDHPAALYTFSEQAGCLADNINQDCSTLLGTVMPAVPAGTKRSTLFTPRSDGRYLLAVDAVDPLHAGAFTLSLRPVTPNDDRVCALASPLTLTAGKGLAQSTTATAQNDLGAHVFCGGPRLVGPQRYHRVDLLDRPYQLRLSVDFDAVLAVGAACDTLPIDCASGGLSGTTLAVPSGQAGTVSFTPPSAGTYLLAVDSESGGSAGGYRLEVQELVPPQNGACASPSPLTLVAGSATVSANTGQSVNDLGPIACGDPQGPFLGPQAYYALSLQAGQSAQLRLTPELLFDGALYVFDKAVGCAAAAVDVSCVGRVSDQTGGGVVEQLTVAAPTGGGELIIVVDSWSPSEVGSYTLEVVVAP